MFSSDCRVDLENFVRGGNPEKTSQGQVTWSAQFDSSPDFQKQHKAPSTDFSRFISGFTAGAIDFDGEEPGDEFYFENAGWGMNDGGNRRVMKWSLTTNASINPGTRGAELGAFTLQVFARGTSICDYDWVVKSHDPETREARMGWSRQEEEFCDMIAFQVVRQSDNATIASWGIPGDLTPPGWPDADDAEKHQRNAIFDMQMRGGWVSTKPLVQTAEGWDPCFALLVAYLAAYEFSPDAIKSDLDSDFPSDPNGWPG